MSTWLLPFLIFTLWGVISLLISPYLGEAARKGAYQVIGLAGVLGAGAGILHIVRAHPSMFLRLIRVLLFALALLGGVGVLQFVLATLLGRPDLLDFTFANDLSGGPVWGDPGYLGVIRRANSFASEPAHLGHFLGLGVGTAFVRVGVAGRKLKEAARPLLPVWLAVPILLGSLLSFSFLSYMILVLAALSVRVLAYSISRKTAITLGAVVLLALAGTWIASLVAGPGFQEKLTSPALIWTGPDPGEEITQGDDSALILAAQVHVMRQNVLARPPLGMGLGAHPYAYEDEVPYYLLERPWLLGVNAEDAASLLVRLLSETGTVGTVFFIGGGFLLFARARPYLVRAVASETQGPLSPYVAAALGIAGSSIAVFIGSLVRFAEYFPQQLWIGLALTSCIPILLSGNPPIEARTEDEAVGDTIEPSSSSNGS